MMPLRRWLGLSDRDPPPSNIYGSARRAYRQLSPNFNEREFVSKGDGTVGKRGIAPELVMGLELLRAWAGYPLTIVSGYRDPEYNRKVGGSKNSQHLYGRAADIWTGSDIDRLKDLARLAEMVPVFKRGGIGLYKKFIHLDVRGEYGKTMARWRG